jgi:acetyl-CoA C-acetyltransferase
MSDVVIVGVGMIPVGEHWDVSLRSLAARAALAAVRDAGGLKPQAIYIGNVLAPVVSHQANLGAMVADNLGMRGVEGTTVEAAGASGGAALRQGILAVTSGLVDVAMVLGVEKVTDQVGAGIEEALSQTLDADYEAMHGMTLAAQAALVMQRYLEDYDAPRDAFAGFALTAHAHAVHNPYAMYRRAIDLETYRNAPLVSDPLNLYDVAPYADGAAAVIITRLENAPRGLDHPLVRISGSSVVIDTLALHDRDDPLAFRAAGYSAERACRQAGILPRDVDFLELHDAFSVYAAISLEAAGFAPRGQGWKLGQDRHIGRDGDLPVNTFGGMKARGYPIGAAGVYQAVEAALQLRGQAGECQVPGARIALIQSLGGPASTAAAHVLERMD